MGPKEVIIFLAGLMLGVVMTLFGLLVMRIFAPWLRAFLGGAPVSMFGLIGMMLRGSPVNLLIDTNLALVHSGKPVKFSIREIESKYIAHRHKIMTSQDLIELLLDDAASRT
ncbi:hypothetical protein NA78x_002350 [Anatilimnocola sp. NA78]|uniref:hypothetical protein n=1 Tax=Anatilimnocola sp. NA78 TaxID=3415683 RepID=UPI003CE4B0AA